MPAQTSAAVSAPETPRTILHRGHAPDQEYYQACPACRAADKARSALDVRTLEDKDLDLYTFLIPDVPGCAIVCRAYLAHKYPDAPWIGSTLDLAKLGGWRAGENIVVVRRDCWPRPSLMPAQRRKKDAEDKWEWVDVTPEEMMAECVESAPIDVRAHMDETRADRFTKSQLDYTKLIKKISEQMVQPYRIDLPKDYRDTVMRMCWQ